MPYLSMDIHLSFIGGPVSMAITSSGTKAYVLAGGTDDDASPRILPMLVRTDGTLIYSAQSPMATLPTSIAAKRPEGKG